MNAGFSAALLDPALPCPAGLCSWNGSDPARRFSVYRNNVMSSLVDALGANLPVVQALVGEVFFRAMAAEFVRRAPPRSPVLAFYGEEMPSFVDSFAPARSVPYLADMARLEMARQRAYHAADAAPIGTAEAGQAMACGDAVGTLRLRWHPSVALLSSSFAIVSIWAAHQHDEGVDDALAPIDPRSAEDALVLRDGHEVLVHRLAPAAAAFVRAVQSGADLGTAATCAAAVDAGFDLTALLSLMVSHGALSAIQLPRSPTP